ncbi:MAG TPA: glucose-6-phosphate dehydrogenase [archaeon]|nr:glucose-6-phosphate dehydrogenase [archaeon]
MEDNFSFIILGATGDLAQKKLFPAVHNLVRAGRIGKNFSVVAVARKDISREEFAAQIREGIGKKLHGDSWKTLEERLYYFQLDFNDAEGFKGLADFMGQIEARHNTGSNRLFYLATLPNHFESIARNLKKCGLSKSGENWCKAVFEKPFGHDEKSAKTLNKQILQAFNESQIYRIDHYLGKELVQNIGVVRFANMIFAPLWNRKGIDHVQINLVENFGVESRGEFYDNEGALRDVCQSHLLQLLCLTTMNVPKRFDDKCIRDEKVKVLKAVKKISAKDVVLGQYAGYTGEEGVKKGSKTETFFALKLFIGNDTWKGVPFYLRSGKNLAKKFSSIYIQFKRPKHRLLEGREIAPNYMVIQIQPDDGMLVQLNGKLPGEKMRISPVKMTFCHECAFGPNTPEAYETLILDALNGNQEAFMRADEIEHSWKIIDALTGKNLPVHAYDKGSFGPKEADELIKKDGYEWFNKIENMVQGL